MSFLAVVLAVAAVSAPHAAISVAPTAPVAGSTVTLSADGSTCGRSTPCVFKWYNSTRYLGTGKTLKIAFPATTVNLRLKVYNRKGVFKAQTSKKVVVKPVPPPPPPVTTPPPPVTTPTPPPPPPVTTPDPTPPPPTTPDCTTHATPSTFAKAISSAAGGSTVCLAAGDYGQFDGASKSSLVTVKPETGASVAMSLKLDAGTSNIRFDGISDLGGWLINGSKNVQITNSTITYPTSVLGATPGLVFDHDTFDGLPAGTWEGRLSFASGASGAVVKNSHFGNGGCSDGIQFTGSSHDVLVQGNEFSNLHQGSCSAHVDPIQFYGASNITVDSNYFHDTSTGVMTPDGNGSPFTITRNVFVSSGDYPWAIVDGGGRNDVIDHNTIVGWTVEVGQANGGQNASNETVSNNVLPGITILSPQPASGVNDTGNFTGTPTFVGGAHPTTYGDYKATNTSAGI